MHKLYLKSEHLRKIRKITNEIASAGAYGEKNMEEQMLQFDKLKVPEWEKDVLKKAWSFKKKLAHSLARDLNKMIDDLQSDSGGNEDGENV